jgi:hypothetical protein
MTRKDKLDLTFSIILIIWGGALWFFIVRSRLYDNVLAIIFASINGVIGVVYLIKSIRRLTMSR